MSKRILLGMLTPSSNTVLEPVTTQMIAGLPEASAHFGRFRVTEIALSDKALGQFDDSEILRAAELLSHAKVHSIGWSGTSSGWLGFEADEGLCRRITEATGREADPVCAQAFSAGFRVDAPASARGITCAVALAICSSTVCTAWRVAWVTFS